MAVSRLSGAHVMDADSRRLHRLGRAERWGLSVEEFATVVSRSVAAASRSAPAAVRPESLHLEDLALASACARGHDGAWEHFVREYRPVLYRAADAIEPGGGARDLADGLYADLFGLAERDGERRSLFSYFHGRSSLGTWLRAVLSQRLVDRVRSGRRLDPLDEEAAIPAPEPVDPQRGRYVGLMHTVLLAAISALADPDRLKLGLYYREQLTLAQIARLTGEHEATVSRHLSRIRKDLRARAVEALRAEGLAEAEIADCAASLAADAGPLDLGEWLSPAAARKNPAGDRSQ